MKTLKIFKALVLLFAFIAIFAGSFTILSAGQVNAARCCWVRVCSELPPYACWDVCKPCPKLP